MLSTTISNTLGVLVLVSCNFFAGISGVVDNKLHLQWQMVWPLVFVGRCYANLNYVWQMFCKGVADVIATWLC